MAAPVRARLAIALLAFALVVTEAPPHLAARQAEPLDAAVFRELSWRPLGPGRAGRVTAAAGVAALPHVFYVAADGGGLWKTTDYGQSWRPSFEQQVTGAVSAVAVASSRPETVYVGTGADGRTGPAMTGDGLFVSADAGDTWTRTRLDVRGTIARILVHPRDPQRILVAVVETPADPDATAGIFRSIDGGAAFTRVLTTDARGGQLDLATHPTAPETVYALADEGFFRSEDEGATWQPVTTGLPAAGSGLTRGLAIAVSPARPDRLLASIGTADTLEIHRSDDRGATWSRLHVGVSSAAHGTRVGLVVDPRDADVVYGVDGLVRRSEDGGRTWTPWRSAEGDGIDLAWIHPSQPDVMLLGGRAGATITVNRGETWSAPDGLASADIGAIGVDAAFPYRVCGPLRGGPAICVPSYQETGALGASLALPAVFGATSAMAPDPGNPDVLYVRHQGGLTRYDSRTGQRTPVGPSIDLADAPGPVPLVFGPDGKTLYLGDRTLWRSANGGINWTAVGPAPVASTPGEPPSVITTIALSAIAPRTIWVGASDGLVHVTRDAAETWTAVTPSQVPAGAGIVSVDASHFDTSSAYVVIAMASGAAPVRASTPLVFRTRDGGVTWTPVTDGLPDARVHVVREDALRRGLLFAGTDRGVYLSFDDAERWQRLPLNLPAAPVRDLMIHEDDLLAATGGRGVWVLDDISPMRQVTADVLRAPTFLFRPATAWRVRAGAGSAPSRGANEAALHYLVGPEPPAVLTLEIIATTSGELLRRFSSAAPAGGPDWIDPTPGLHRRLWDLRYSTVPPADPGTPAVPGLRVPAGAYQVRLTADGRPQRQAVSIRLDPRVRASATDLAAQFALAQAVDERRRELAATRAAGGAGSTPTSAAAELDALARMLDQFDGRPNAAIEAAVAAALR